jgi:two-component system, NtrC family, response regulator HydG
MVLASRSLKWGEVMSKILIIEDNATLREGLVQVITRMGHETFSAPGGKVGLELFAAESPDLVLTDLKMEGVDGMEVLSRILTQEADALVIIVTAFGSIEGAVDAMQKGAFDFIPKPFPPDLLRSKVERALEVREQRGTNEKLSRENEILRQQIDSTTNEIIGSSNSMLRVQQRLKKIARSDSTVHIYGESGTGKELAAKQVHEASTRLGGPFITVNCSALAESLLESELFGHEKGAFTGAQKRKIGRFELAHRGTIFLDEIGDVSLSTQVKLLRVLQDRRFERVGGEKTIEVDVRVITATNKKLEEEIKLGNFREDLYYRLNIIPVTLPALRDRVEDIQELIEHFMKKLRARTRNEVGAVSPEVLRAMMGYHWPGNIRELENVIEHAMVFCERNTIQLDDLPPVITGKSRGRLLQIPDMDASLPEILEGLEEELIRRSYEKAGGVKTETARQLGIKPSALYYKLEKYGIDQAAGEDDETGND